MSDNQIEKILSNSTPQYLEITKDLTFNDCAGRRMLIYVGARGFVLNEETISLVHGVSADKRVKMMHEMMECFDRRVTYAFVCSYACMLAPGDYRILDDVPHHCLNELL